MAAGQMQRSIRKLNGKIGGRDVFAREMLNSDLDETDEAQDEYDELVRRRDDLVKQIDAESDGDARRELRAQIRALARETRKVDERMLGLYVEAEDGQRFSAEEIAATPIRTQTLLMAQAAKFVHGGADEVPTPGQAASD